MFFRPIGSELLYMKIDDVVAAEGVYNAVHILSGAVDSFEGNDIVRILRVNMSLKGAYNV